MLQNELGGNVAFDNADQARQALAKSDLAGALYHVSSALATEPQNRQWRAILDEVLTKAPDPMVFVRKDEPKHDYITAATRSYVHAFKREWLDAFALVAEVCAVRPDAPFLLWATEWAQQPGALDAISADDLEKRVLPPIARMASSLPSPTKETDERRKNVDAAAGLLNAFYAKHPQHPFLSFVIASVLRRQGQFDLAIQYAGHAHQLKNDWNTSVGLACAYRDAKKVDEAVQWFRHAYAQRPDDVSALLDIGDSYLDAKRWDEAIGAYREVLAKQPNEDWASASILYATFEKSQAPADFDALFDASGRSRRAQELYFRIVGDHPYFTWLPHPGDSTYFAARQVVADLTRRPPATPTLGIDVHLTHMEAPSALRAFKLWTDTRNWKQVGMRALVEGVQQPDTRYAKGQVDFQLWAFDDKVPRPNCPAPDPRVQQAIAAIVVKPFALSVWDRDAKALAAQMGPRWLNQLLYTMVQPPPLPQPNSDPFFWLQKVQIAVTLVIANLDAGWEGSTRKRALESIARGPVDWTVDAAVIAMGWIAKNDPSARPAIEQFFAWLETQIPTQGFTCYEYPLVNVWRNLGGHPKELQDKLDRWKARCETQKIEFAEEKHAGLTLEEYAKMCSERDGIMGRVAMQGQGMQMGQAVGGALLGGLARGLIGGMAGNIAGGALAGGVNSMGYQGELQQLCAKYRVPALQGGLLGRVPAWDQRIQNDPNVQKKFLAAQQKAALAAQGVSAQEQRAMAQVMSGGMDVESMKQNHQVAVQQIAAGQGGDADPVVFPGGKVAKLSDYVGLLRGMQGGDFNGALRKYGLDMGSYTQVAQAWGAKLASDPVLNAKFGKMMSGV